MAVLNRWLWDDAGVVESRNQLDLWYREAAAADSWAESWDDI